MVIDGVGPREYFEFATISPKKRIQKGLKPAILPPKRTF
jgi:hypothetical protein